MALLVVTLCAWLFGELADDVREQETIFFDAPILEFMRTLHSDWLTMLVTWLTQLGGVMGATIIVVFGVIMLWRFGQKTSAWMLGVGVAGAALINIILKSIFARARPDLWEHLVVETFYSFPSGHAMASSALAFSLILIAWRTRWRWPVVATALIYMLVIGLTRLYLGVHYPSDVLAGWAISLAWVVIVAVVLGILRLRRSS